MIVLHDHQLRLARIAFNLVGACKFAEQWNF
jgi:hypothetical protein